MNYWQIRQAARHVHCGGVIAYPTEAVYGLGCDPLNADAVLRILALKQRDMDQGLILIAASQDQLTPYILPPGKAIQTKLDASWPGPTTWLLPPRTGVPHWITGAHDLIAVRVSDHPVVQQLCHAVGYPLISTSANPAGLPPARNALTVTRYFHHQLDFIVTGRVDTSKNPTTIKNAKTGKVIRSG